MYKPEIQKGCLVVPLRLHGVYCDVKGYTFDDLTTLPILLQPGELCLVMNRNVTSDPRESGAAALHQKSGKKILIYLKDFERVNNV